MKKKCKKKCILLALIIIVIIIKTLWWDTIKRITSCRPELLMLPYSHKGCQRSPTKLVYRRLHRSGRKQVKRLLFRGEKTSFFTSTVMNGLRLLDFVCFYFIKYIHIFYYYYFFFLTQLVARRYGRTTEQKTEHYNTRRGHHWD